MLIVAVPGFGADRFQVAPPPERGAFAPATATFLPTNSRAAVFCAVCCNDTSVPSWSLDFSCCSTCANATSCWVNWLVSIGLNGSWFCNCVVSSDRKVVKLPAIVLASMPVVLAVELLAVVEDVVGIMPLVAICCSTRPRVTCDPSHLQSHSSAMLGPTLVLKLCWYFRVLQVLCRGSRR